ncbi:MAG: hypothetical protein K9M94_08790 [Spirochaetia bacterium]|nr:hypothetical protein [Spirochaetia bacterium]
MRNHPMYAAIWILISSLVIAGCAGTPPAEEEVDSSHAVTAPEPEQTSEPVVDEQQTTEPQSSQDKSTEEYTMGEEEYQETKKDLANLVQELNQIIANRNYQEWLDYLTKEYKDYYSDPEVLKEYSEAPLLQKYDIKLRSLKDYFNYVVVASRKDVRIDDIKPLSENKVRAYMNVNGEPIVVYTLEKVDSQWKITK